MKTKWAVPSIVLCSLLQAGGQQSHEWIRGISIGMNPDGRPRLSWAAVAGHRYAIESVEVLEGNWERQGTVAAESSAAEWVDASATAATRFYRISDLGEETSAGISTDIALQAGDLLPAELLGAYEISSQAAGEAVQVATQLSGSQVPVTTGTLTQDSTGRVSYVAQPVDQLRVLRHGYPELVLTIHEFNLNTGIYEWTQEVDGSNVRIRFEPGMQADSIRITGTYLSPMIPDLPWELDILMRRSGFSDTSGGGTHQLSDVTTTGTVDGHGVSLTLETRQRFEIITTSNPSRSASTNESWNNSTLRIGGETFEWLNATKRKSFSDGVISQYQEYWNATGELRRNGQPFATYRKMVQPFAGSQLQLLFQLVLPDRVIEIESWMIRI